jgi:hypothetical protein
VLQAFGIRRSADLNLFEVAELCYDLEIDPGGLTTTELHVQVRSDGTWHTVKEHDLATAADTSVMIPISDYLSADFQVRFIVPDVLSGGLLGLDLLYTGDATLDNVTIRGIVASGGSTTSTTSTTLPKPTTSTSAPPAQPSTTPPSGAGPTTSVGSTGSTTAVAAGPRGEAALPAATTSTTTPGDTTTSTSESTTTTSAGVAATGQPPGPSSGSGLRDAGIGLLADYQTGIMVDLDLQNVEVLGADLVVDFSLAVEIFEAARVWIAILVLMVTAAVVSGMDRRRRSGQTSR